MRSEFYGKRIAFLGDSLFHHGHFLDYLRAHFDGRADKPLLFNRGLGGNTAEMVKELFSDEILSLRPDYCFVAFGANDVGGWLYDEASEVTEEVLRDRAERDRIHIASMREVATLLKEAGITPILCTTIAFNELIVEDKDIETLADNKEKGEKIKSTLYTKRAFQSINNTFRRYREALARTAEDTGSELCDLFSVFIDAQYKDLTLYEKDGVHLTADGGHLLLAKAILSHLGEEELLPRDSQFVREFRELEQKERSVQYVKWAFYHPIFGPVTNEKIKEEMEAMYRDPASPPHRKHASGNYLKYKGDATPLRKKLREVYG